MVSRAVPIWTSIPDGAPVAAEDLSAGKPISPHPSVVSRSEQFGRRPSLRLDIPLSLAPEARSEEFPIGLPWCTSEPGRSSLTCVEG